MTELLTESFCERCGTRYTFEASERRRGGTSRLRVLSLGLRTFIANDDTSLAEAMAAARSDEERAIAARQMDAFHRTFNFCFSCRQYICANCWNDLAGTCLTCNPLEVAQYERSASLDEVPPFAEDGVGPVPAAPEVPAASPGMTAFVAEGPAAAADSVADRAFEAPTAAPGPAPLLRPRLEATARPRTGTAAPGSGAQAADAEPAVTTAAAEPSSANAGSAAPSLEEEANVGASLADAMSADELTADELQTVREALGAGPIAEDAVTSAVEPEAAEAFVASLAEPGAAEPEAAALAATAPDEPEAAAIAAAEAVQPEPTTPAASAPESGAPARDGGRAPAALRPSRFGRLRTGGLLDRYRPAPVDGLPAAGALEADHGGPGASTAPSRPERAPDVPAATAPAFVARPPAPSPSAPAAPRRPTRAEPPAAPAAGSRDVASQPVWSVVAPDTDEEPARPWAPGPRTAARPLDLPPSAWAARLATARPDDVWAISAQDVVTSQAGAPAPSVQPCVQCGLALSANARFCRRCGAGQG